MNEDRKQQLIDKIKSSDQIANTVVHILDALVWAKKVGRWVIVPEGEGPVVVVDYNPELKKKILAELPAKGENGN